MGTIVEIKRTKQEYVEGKLATKYTETTRYSSNEPQTTLLKKIVPWAGALVSIMGYLNKLLLGLLG